jgi:3-oxoacyl-[acyl-carrier protein] reductase
MELAGMHAIVTGAARGIGRGIALALASEGIDVAVNYARSRLQAEETAAAVRGLGRKAITVQADVSRPVEARRLAETALGEFGSLEILVNNAGLDKAGEKLLEMSEETWDRILAVNLKGAFNCCQAVATHMAARRFGRIVNVASIAGLRGTGNAAYVASKAGMIGLTMALARELVDQGITVNAVAPGMVDTEMLAAAFSKEQLADVRKEVPVGWLGRPEHIASGVLFLLRNEYVTGQVLNISGGRMIGL